MALDSNRILDAMLQRVDDVLGASSGRRSASRSRSYIPLRRLLMLSLQNEPDNKNSKRVRVIRMVPRTENNGRKIYDSVTVTRISGQNPRVWRQQITCEPDDFTGKISEAPGVNVTCTCQRFMYMWEYVLWKAGAAPLLHGNGEPPDVTNPTHKIACCKHLVRALAEIATRRL